MDSIEEGVGLGNIRIDDKHPRRLRQVQRNTASFQGDQENLYVDVLHKIVDGILALRGRHTPIQHDGVEPSPSQPPLDELQHGSKLREHNGFVRLLLTSQLVELVDEHFDLRRRCPVLHADSVYDRVLLDVFFLLLDIWLLEVDRQWDVAARTINDGVCFEGPDVILCAAAAEFMTTARSDGFLGGFVADTADENILSALCVLLQNQVRVVGHLSHLHDKTEDVGVVVQHDTSAHIGIKLPCRVGHDTS